jgi:vancomycin aglycone glucosyltransferase
MFADGRPLPAALQRFLDARPAPVYIGFGSMPVPTDISSGLVSAVRAVGHRVILSRGWAGLALTDSQPDCLVIDDVDHQALFPRVAAVIHHGGAGTTASAARAGVPQVIVPMFSDQFYWGRRISNLGAGVAIPITELTAEPLAQALDLALSRTVVETARALAGRVPGDGARVAASLLAAYG